MAARGSPRRLHAAISSDEDLNLQSTSQSVDAHILKKAYVKIPRIGSYFLFKFDDVTIINMMIRESKKN